MSLRPRRSALSGAQQGSTEAIRRVAALVFGIAAVAAFGCSSEGGNEGSSGSGGALGKGGDRTGGNAGVAGTNTTGGVSGTGGVAGRDAGNSGSSGDAGSSGGGPCEPIACASEAGTYCGSIGDGCGESLDCGECNGDWTCEEHVCVGGPDCTSRTECSVGPSTFCGSIGDGCGRSLECPACPDGFECKNRICVEPDCEPTSCEAADGSLYCGTIGDGCGGTLTCDDCPAGYTCGGGALDGVCGAEVCPTLVQCNDASGEQQYCGRIGNGCGGILDCPDACANGATCGMEIPNVCPGVGGM